MNLSIFKISILLLDIIKVKENKSLLVGSGKGIVKVYNKL